MKIVIDIPQGLKIDFENENWTALTCAEMKNALMNGTPLSKGHGRLGDLDKIIKEMQNYHDDCAKTSEYTRLGFETAIAVVEDADTVIEADKGEQK